MLNAERHHITMGITSLSLAIRLGSFTLAVVSNSSDPIDLCMYPIFLFCGTSVIFIRQTNCRGEFGWSAGRPVCLSERMSAKGRCRVSLSCLIVVIDVIRNRSVSMRT